MICKPSKIGEEVKLVEKAPSQRGVEGLVLLHQQWEVEKVKGWKEL